MIVRVLGEGQYEVANGDKDALGMLDDELDAAIATGDGVRFTRALEGLVEQVRASGTLLDPGTIVPSDLVVPPPDASLDEVRALLDSEVLEED